MRKKVQLFSLLSQLIFFFWISVGSVAGQSADTLSAADLQAMRIILNEEERQEFDRLTTLEEKREWARIYWKKRDPTPTTEKNERLEEFLRRLAHVRQWFRAPGELGFDDRGRIYLRYGEPSERYIYPVGDMLVRPNESWSYSGIYNGLVFDFVARGSYYRLVDDLSQALVARTEPGPEMMNLISLYESRAHLDPKYDRVAAELRRVMSVNFGEGETPTDPRNYAIGNINLARLQLAELTGDLARIKSEAPRVVYRHDYKKKPLAIAHSLARFRDQNGRVRVEIYFGIPYNQLKFEQIGRYWQAELRGGIAIFDEKYRRIKTDTLALQVMAPDLKATLKGAYISQFNFQLDPGQYHMALRIEHPAGNRLGILRADFECPQYPADRLAMSDLQLSPKIVITYRNVPTDPANQDRFTKHGLRIMPLPGLTIDRSRRLFVYFEIYNLGRNAEGKTRYEIEYALRELEGKKSLVGRLFGGKKPVLAVTEVREGTEPNPTEYIGIELHKQPEGKYMLEVTVRDQIKKEEARSAVPIRVTASRP